MPEIISESEERERITSMAERDFLIKSQGIQEQIYIVMKKNGSLRPADIKKYGFYEKMLEKCQSPKSAPSTEQKLYKTAQTFEAETANITNGKSH